MTKIIIIYHSVWLEIDSEYNLDSDIIIIKLMSKGLNDK